MIRSRVKLTAELILTVHILFALKQYVPPEFLRVFEEGGFEQKIKEHILNVSIEFLLSNAWI